MVPVATDHAPDIVDGDLLPRFVTNVLPTGDFLEHEQAQFVAGVEKVTRLRIMRSADNVALELSAQNLRIAALGAAGHRLPDEGKRLVTVQSAELDDLAIQLEAVVGELSLAKTKAARISVQQLRSAAQAHSSGIEVALFQIPQADSTQTLKMQRMRNGFARRA